jgi:Tol biopolymer transport system component
MRRALISALLGVMGLSGVGTHLPARAAACATTERVAPFRYRGDGRLFAYATASDVFVRDRQTGEEELVGVDSDEQRPPGSDGFGGVTLSPDGRFVTFLSGRSGLAPGESVGAALYLRDREAGTTERVSVDSNGVAANEGSSPGAVTPDGRYVAFSSFASNLVAGDTNAAADVFVRDRVAGTTTRVSLRTDGTEAPSAWAAQPLPPPTISDNGVKIAFSTGLDLTGDDPYFEDVYVWDRLVGTTTRANVSSAGVVANQGVSGPPWLSASGNLVA